MITIETQGGLGNQLFQAALALEIRLTRSIDVQLDVWRHELTGGRDFELDALDFGFPIVNSRQRTLYFPDRLGGISRKFRPLFSSRVIVEKGHAFNDKYVQVPDLSVLAGYFQSWKYSLESVHTIRSVFQAVSDQSDWVKSRISILEESGPWFAVHVRRGDYLTKQGQSVHGTLPSTYYIEAVNFMRESTQGARPVLFSDEPIAAYRALKVSIPDLDYFADNQHGSNLENFKLLSRGSGVVTANSSFSWWAARLSEFEGKPVVAPRKWFANKRAPLDDLIPPAWNIV